MTYEYKMVQVPPNIATNRKNINTAAADYLEDVVNEWASRGWEFFRIDDFSTQEPAGCFSGGKVIIHSYKVITFRKEKM